MTRKKGILRKIRMSEISNVDRPAQAGALALIMKSDRSPEVVSKQLFTQVLEGMELERSVFEVLDQMWNFNEALRMSIQRIVETQEELDDPVGAVRDTLSQFASAVSAMVSEAIGEVDDDLIPDEENANEPGGVMKFTAEDYAYVPDPSNPSTWRLRLSRSPGEPDPMLIEAAAVALTPDLMKGLFEVPDEDRAEVIAKVRDLWNDEGELPDVLKSSKEKRTMNKPMDKEPTVESLQADLQKRDEELKIVKAVASMNDAEKAHYNSLEGDDKGDFLAKTDAERQAIMKNLADANPVVYTSADGEEFRKNDDPRLVRMAKAADEDRKIAKREREERENLELRKRAEDELGHLPGDADVKVSLLKAVNGIENEGTRKAATELLAAADKAMTKNFESRGSRAASHDSSAVDELDKLAKNHAKEHEVSYAEAYDAILKTDEGRRLYNESVA